MRIKRGRMGAAVASLALASLAAPVLANYTCSGQVRGVAIDVQSGHLMAESVGSVSWPRFCSFRGTENGIAPEDCKRMYSALLVAQATGKSVTFWVTSAGTTCPPNEPWQFINGLYFLRIDG
jgi:hypothetical protein